MLCVQMATYISLFIAPSHPYAEVTKLLCPHHEGAGAYNIQTLLNSVRTLMYPFGPAFLFALLAGL